MSYDARVNGLPQQWPGAIYRFCTPSLESSWVKKNVGQDSRYVDDSLFCLEGRLSILETLPQYIRFGE